jgi:hypothetical protein
LLLLLLLLGSKPVFPRAAQQHSLLQHLCEKLIELPVSDDVSQTLARGRGLCLQVIVQHRRCCFFLLLLLYVHPFCCCWSVCCRHRRLSLYRYYR